MKLLLTTICVASMSFAVTTHAQASEHRSWRYEECRYRFSDGHAGFTHREVEREIGCATAHWRVAGGTRAARCVADHESGDRRLALNPSSGTEGIYQFMPSTFRSTHRRHRGLVRRWHLRGGAFNARTNVVLAVRMASAGSWAPWSTAGECGV